MSANNWRGHWNGSKPKGDHYQKARKVVRPTGTFMRGIEPSRKNGRMVEFEGLLERDAIFLFETSPKIVRYREQPIKIKYPDGSRLRTYTPDFELTLNTGEIILIEVKHRSSLEHEKVRHKLESISQYLAQTHQQFLVLTDAEIRKEPRLSNLKIIKRQLPRVWPTEAAIVNFYQLHSHKFPTTYDYAIQLLFKENHTLASLIVAGLITLDLDRYLDSETLIYSIEEQCHDSFWISKKYGF